MRKVLSRAIIAGIAGAVLSISALALPASANANQALPTTSGSTISQVWYEYGDFHSWLGCTNKGQWFVRELGASDWMCVPSNNHPDWSDPWTLFWSP